jgi:hypothetical protein
MVMSVGFSNLNFWGNFCIPAFVAEVTTSFKMYFLQNVFSSSLHPFYLVFLEFSASLLPQVTLHSQSNNCMSSAWFILVSIAKVLIANHQVSLPMDLPPPLSEIKQNSQLKCYWQKMV